MKATSLKNVIYAAILVSAAALCAQAPLHDKPASPQSLPADNLPPFGMLDASGHLTPTPPEIAAAALQRGKGHPRESTARGPGMKLAIDAAKAAITACTESGYDVGVSVVDSVGEARAMLTADGADGSHVFVATRKALTALAFKMPSSEARDAVHKNNDLLPRVTPAMFVEGGAVPIMANGEIIGAIGVSGAGGAPIGHQDEVCARAGLDAIRSQLK